MHTSIHQPGQLQHGRSGAGVPHVVHEALRSPGRQLDPTVSAFMQPRFGHDFSKVRIHTDATAARSADATNARAYTSGKDIVFGQGEYAPHTVAGRSLIAHELAHVVQQQERSDTPLIQRAVKTWGGDFDTDAYDVINTGGVTGVNMNLRFKPNDKVNAELVGLTQTARSTEKGTAVPASTFVNTDAEKKAFEGYRIPSGDANAGTMVDQLVKFPNPMYATAAAGAGDKLADTPTKPVFGQHGWHYKDGSGNLQQQDALLKDGPTLPAAMKESKQVFESAALALKGEQNGTYYGSVQWGWQKDAAGNVSKLPLSVVSKDVPSSVFAKAAEIWNKAKTSEGKDTIPLPIAEAKFTNTDGVWLVSDPTNYKRTIVGELKKNTRLEVISKGEGKPFNKTADKFRWWKVTITEGVRAGETGWVMQADLSDTKSVADTKGK